MPPSTTLLSTQASSFKKGPFFAEFPSHDNIAPKDYDSKSLRMSLRIDSETKAYVNSSLGIASDG
jgi:hypothetical protein